MKIFNRLLMIIIVMFFLKLDCFAKKIIVNSIEDTISLDFCTFRGAIELINNVNFKKTGCNLEYNKGGDIILFSDTLKEKTIYLNNEVEIKSNIIIDANNTRISLSGKKSNRILNINNVSVSISGISFIDGYIKGEHKNGGAILATFDSFSEENVIECNNCYFINNYAEESGAGISLDKGYLVLDKSYFLRNKSEDFGGGISVDGVVSISNSFFLENESKIGGAIDVNSSKFNTKNNISSSVFIDNKSKMVGGAISGIYINIIENNLFKGNTASNGAGGAFHGGVRKVINSYFIENTSCSRGGAIISENIDIHRSGFYRNSSFKGGALYLLSKANIVDNSFIENNSNTGEAVFYEQDSINMNNLMLLNNHIVPEKEVIYLQEGTSKNLLSDDCKKQI